MKRLFGYLFAILCICCLVACKTNAPEGNENEVSESGQNIDANATDQPASLLPENVNPDEAIPVGKLKEAFFNWSDQEVVIIGYCDFFFDHGSIGEKIALKSGSDAEDKLVECEMKQSYDEEFDKTVPVTIKGKISGTWQKTIELKDCELIEKGKEAEDMSILDPADLPESPIPIDVFHNSYFGWHDKEVTVIGYYQSVTTSTTDYGVTIRVDLADPDSNKKAVGCRMKEEPPENLKDNRNNVKIRGIIKGEAFGNVLMEECVLVQ